jgi:hypothetical protein
MKFFYLSSNPNPNGEFIVHSKDCPEIPSTYEREYLGPYNSVFEALRNISSKKINSNACLRCSCKREIYVLRP